MEPEVLSIILDLTRDNARHIETLNREMGSVMANVEIIKWFIGANVVAWISIATAQIWRRILRSNGK